MTTITYLTSRQLALPVSHSQKDVEETYQQAKVKFEELSRNGELGTAKTNVIIRMIQDVLNMNPQHLKTLDLSARLNLRMGNPEVALAIIEIMNKIISKEMSTSPIKTNNSLTLYALATRADAHLRLLQFSKALKKTNKILRHHRALPRTELSYVLTTKAEALSCLKKEPEASVARELSKLSPVAVETAYQIVEKEFKDALRNGMLETSIVKIRIFGMLRDILKVNLKHLKTLDLAARLHVKIEKPEVTLEIIKNMNSLTLYTKATRAHAYLCLDQFMEALQETDEILKNDLDIDEMAYVLETRAQALYNSGRTTEALGVIQELKKLNPNAAERVLVPNGQL